MCKFAARACVGGRIGRDFDTLKQFHDLSYFSTIVRNRAYAESMWTVIWILIVVWAVLAIVGFALEGLLWLGIIGIVLLVGTAVLGLIRRQTGRRSV